MVQFSSVCSLSTLLQTHLKLHFSLVPLSLFLSPCTPLVTQHIVTTIRLPKSSETFIYRFRFFSIFTSLDVKCKNGLYSKCRPRKRKKSLKFETKNGTFLHTLRDNCAVKIIVKSLWLTTSILICLLMINDYLALFNCSAHRN